MSKINQNGLNTLIRYYNGIENIPFEELKFVDDDIWQTLTQEQKEKLLPKLFDYWNEQGFPFPESNIQETTYEYDELLSYDVRKLWKHKGNEISQSMLGLRTANSYHPHKYKVKSKTYRIPYDNFEDKEVLKKVIMKSMRVNGNPLLKTKMRKMLSIYQGTQGASNFRPTVAKLIYEMFTPIGGKVLDPSLGYSGRLLGALSSHISHYEGCDPCLATYNGGLKMIEDITTIENKRNKLSMFMDSGERSGRLPTVKLHNIPFEEYVGEDNFFDTVFTSPPYFNKEMYSDEENQSWKRYPQYDEWVDGFLRPLVKTAYRVLKPNGRLILNITGKVGKRCLEEDTIKLGNEFFGKENRQEDIHLLLSKVIGSKGKGKLENRNDRDDYRVEPMFHWIKKD
jgi:DNA modification methylase